MVLVHDFSPCLKYVQTMNDFWFPRDRLQSSGELGFIHLTVNIVKVVVKHMHIVVHYVTVLETSEAFFGACYFCTSRDTLSGT